MPQDVPQNIEASAHLADGFKFGSSFVRDEIPQDTAATGRVLDLERRPVTEKEFLRQVHDEYC